MASPSRERARGVLRTCTWCARELARAVIPQHTSVTWRTFGCVHRPLTPWFSSSFLTQPGYYGLDTGLGCVPCNCSGEGSISDNCTEEGQCHCVPGVSGKQCDQCSHGFYAFQNGGCTRKHWGTLCSLKTYPVAFLGVRITSAHVTFLLSLWWGAMLVLRILRSHCA